MAVDNNSLDLSTSNIDNSTSNTQGNGGNVNGSGSGASNTNPDNLDNGNGNGNNGLDNHGDGNQGQIDNGQDNGNPSQDSSTGEESNDNTLPLEPNTTVTIDDVPCTIDEQGNAVDAQGNIFKTVKEVAELVAANASQEPSLLDTLTARFGSEYKDADGNPIVFEDTPEGVLAYIDTVLEAKLTERQEATLNSLFTTYPQLEQAYTYLRLKGTLEGFNEIPDRSGIVLDKDNEEQLMSVIREEWTLQGKKGDVNKYIDYLKNAGILYDTAVESNKTVAEIYEAQKTAREAELAEKEAAHEKAVAAYWKEVEETINRGEILGYQIPEQIQCTVDGKKIIRSRADFQKYISVPVDTEGNTAYNLDEAKIDSKLQMQDDLLRAYLRFTGGNYSSLVEMAVNKQKVQALRTAAAQTQTQHRRNIVLNSGNSNNSKHVSNDKLVLS